MKAKKYNGYLLYTNSNCPKTQRKTYLNFLDLIV